jgi:hypothetical protein
MPERLLLQAVTVVDRRPGELASRALETKLRDKAQLREGLA